MRKLEVKGDTVGIYFLICLSVDTYILRILGIKGMGLGRNLDVFQLHTIRAVLHGCAAEEYPQYDWKGNKGYPTKKHRAAIREFGVTPYHRMSYNLLGTGELSIDFKD